MDLDISKLWIAGAGLLVGSISGAWIWAQRAAGIAQKAADRAGEDALIETATRVGTGSLAAALQGAFWGGVIGLAVGVAYLYFSDPDRGMTVKKMETGDDC